MLIAEWWNKYLDLRLSHPRIFIYFSIALFFLTLSAFLILSIIYSKISKQVQTARLKKLKKRFDTLISEIILSDSTDTNERHEDRHDFLVKAYKAKYLHNVWAQNFMIERMLDLKRSIEGELERRILTLFRNLELHTNSIKKIKSRHWYIRVKGMKEVAEMQIAEAHYLLIGQLSDRNEHVQREAQIALIKLSPKNPLYFLDQPGILLTKWQKLRIHRFIRKYSFNSATDFSKWLDSANPTVLRFILEMIGLFQEVNSAYRVAQFLTHPNREVRNVAARTLLDLEAFHWSEAVSNAIAVNKGGIEPVFLKAVTELSSGNQGKELALSLIENDNYNLRKQAIQALLKMGLSEDEIISHSSVLNEFAMKRIINHLKDPLLA